MFTRLIIIICLLFASMQVVPAREIIRVTSGEYPPWTSENLKKKGFTNHVIREAFALEGYKVTFTFYPWKRAYEAAKNGKKYQATSYWYPSEERAEDFYYSDPLQTDQTVFFYLDDNPLPDWTTLEDLKGVRIGATREYTYTEEFWGAHKSGELDIQVANSDVLNFNKLIKGRIDTFPTADLVGQKLLREEFPAEVASSVTFHPKPLVASTGHLLISQSAENAEDLLAKFNRGRAKLKKSGRYDEFLQDLIEGRYER